MQVCVQEYSLCAFLSKFCLKIMPEELAEIITSYAYPNQQKEKMIECSLSYRLPRDDMHTEKRFVQPLFSKTVLFSIEKRKIQLQGLVWNGKNDQILRRGTFYHEEMMREMKSGVCDVQQLVMHCTKTKTVRCLATFPRLRCKIWITPSMLYMFDEQQKNAYSFLLDEKQQFPLCNYQSVLSLESVQLPVFQHIDPHLKCAQCAHFGLDQKSRAYRGSNVNDTFLWCIYLPRPVKVETMPIPFEPHRLVVHDSNTKKTYHGYLDVRKRGDDRFDPVYLSNWKTTIRMTSEGRLQQVTRVQVIGMCIVDFGLDRARKMYRSKPVFSFSDTIEEHFATIEEDKYTVFLRWECREYELVDEEKWEEISCVQFHIPEVPLNSNLEHLVRFTPSQGVLVTRPMTSTENQDILVQELPLPPMHDHRGKAAYDQNLAIYRAMIQ